MKVQIGDRAKALLQSMVDSSASPFGLRPPCGGIFSISINNQWWIFATRGPNILAFVGQVTDDFDVTDPTDEPEGFPNIHRLNQAAGLNIGQWLSTPIDQNFHNTSLNHLLGWIRAVGYLQCPLCNGSGKRAISIADKIQGGELADPFEDWDGGSYGTLCGVAISRNLMAATLSHIREAEPQQMNSIWVGKIGEMPNAMAPLSKRRLGEPTEFFPVVLVSGFGWKYLQMATRTEGIKYELDSFENWIQSNDAPAFI